MLTKKPKLSKKLRSELERSLRCLNEALGELQDSKCLGVAKAIEPSRALGSDYDLRNPKCMESTAGLALHVSVSPVQGSKLAMAWTAKDILSRLLDDQ